MHLLRLDGRALRLHRNDAASYALGQGEGLVSWNGDPGNMIDRFDGRALLESYAEPGARCGRAGRRADGRVDGRAASCLRRGCGLRG